MTLVMIFAGVWFATERHRASSVAQVRRPLAIDAFRRLHTVVFAGLSPLDESPETVSRDLEFSRLFQGTPEDWAETVDGYDRLFAKVGWLVDSAWKGFGETYDKSPEERTADENAKVADLIMENQDIVREIRSMAARGAPVRALDLRKGFEVELPHLARLRSWARLLRQDAIVKAMQGNKAEAVEDIIAGMKLGDALVPEPLLITQLLRIAIYGIMNQTVQDCFDGGDLPPRLIRQLIDHMAQADHHRAFADAMAGELYTQLSAFSDMRTGKVSTVQMAAAGQGSTSEVISERVFLSLYGSPLGRPLMNMDEASYVDIMNQIVSAAELVYYRAAPELASVDKEIQILPRARILTKILVPGLVRVCEVQARHEAMLDLARLGLLIERYKAKNGSFPGTLDDIAAELGGSVPVDPFTGRPYHYRPSEDTFLLYSVGRNLRDDGGRHDFVGGDIVWRGKKER
jgi:hypothetical protein